VHADRQADGRTDAVITKVPVRLTARPPSPQMAPLSAAGKAALNYRIVVHDIVPLVAASAVCSQGGKLPPMSGRPILM